MIIIMLGAPGAGKGTQSQILAENVQMPHISTGALFRKNIQENTEIGKEVKAIIEQGALVPDSIVIRMLMERLAEADCENGCILDGFPRTVEQAEALDKELAKDGGKSSFALYLAVSDADVKKRMTGRRVCPKCEASYHVLFNPPKTEGICDKCGASLIVRSDDTEETVSNRLETFHRETEPIIGFYRSKGNLTEIDGTMEPASVAQAILDTIKKYGNN